MMDASLRNSLIFLLVLTLAGPLSQSNLSRIALSLFALRTVEEDVVTLPLEEDVNS